jgi:hypothetical protein
MIDNKDSSDVTPSAPGAVGSDAGELIRDWEFLFWAFLLFGLGRLVWLYLYRPEHTQPFILASLAGSCSAGPLVF